MKLFRHISKTVLIAGLAFSIGCKSTQTSTTTTSKEMQLLPEAPAWGALWQQRAAEYKALCFQAYNFAHQSLDEVVKANNSDKPLAVVTDIDETVLDNSPSTIQQAKNRASFSFKAWKEWTDLAAADTVPGAPAFFKYAASKGVEVFYITNRAISEQASTLKNLQKYGFPFADVKHLLLMGTTSDKEERRKQVAQQYNIVLYCGDNLSDFSSAFNNKNSVSRGNWTQDNQSLFGIKYIVLPNVMYGNWLDAYYDGKPHATNQEANHLMDSIMKGF
ncbi:MAG: 5'-nucleotidase, lipoprotein e(P4) family [Pseudopedobacter saltans]|uniref:5'-nucleotidase, lipoprotein e(P4) family n=1 Tax=Pseudopedobacter saltans TaxID=151895 RepID=A0A2W5F5Z4_9SPHI|nr:MAG: 5'-nucleotidase, lipoprotein e(P4) family [Pseudopedobacter saltans]